jgi:hypothetical protein
VGRDALEDDDTFQMPLPPKEGHDSIFGEMADEDVFGSRPAKPVIPPQPDGPTEQLDPNLAARLEADFGVTNTAITAPMEAPQPIAPQPVAPQHVAPQPVPQFIPQPVAPPEPAPYSPPAPFTAPAPQMEPLGEPIPNEAPSAGTIRSLKKPTVPSNRGGGGLFTWLLLIWALAATAAAVYFATSKSYLHPFQAIPDVYGEYEKADRKKVSKKLLPSEKTEVPPPFRVPVGGSLTMNQLEIQPLKVEAGRFDYFTKLSKDPTKAVRTPEIYLLSLKLKNLSNDLVFHPSDPAFNRSKRNEDSDPLYNKVAIGTAIYPGGLFPWRPNDAKSSLDFLDGQQSDTKPLQPGESREYRIPSQPISRLKESLDNQKGARGLWTVQLRTGRVTANESAGPKEVAVSSVIGVEFKASEIQFRR